MYHCPSKGDCCVHTGIITALRLLYHSNKPIRACLPPSGRETGKAGFGCGVTCAVRCFAAAAAIWRLQTALSFALRILYHVREAAWYNCPSKGGCRASGEPLGITRYNNRSAVIIPHSFLKEKPFVLLIRPRRHLQIPSLNRTFIPFYVSRETSQLCFISSI